MVETEVKPWYREFWLLFIMALPASVVVAGLVTVYIAFKNADSLVADNYYKEGLAINQRLAIDSVATELNLSARLYIDAEIGEVKLKLLGQIDPAPQALKLVLIHPTNKNRDMQVDLRLSPSGEYVGQLDYSLEGRWYVDLTSQQEPLWRLKSEATILPTDTLDNPGLTEIDLQPLSTPGGVD